MWRTLLVLFLVACSNSSTKTDGGGDEPTCTSPLSVCVPNGSQPATCPACAPAHGSTCDTVGLHCGYTNGCSGAMLETANCTCTAPAASDAGDEAGDASDAGATWTCQMGV